MQIHVHLFATLRQGRSARQSIDLPAGSRLADVLARLDIRRSEVSIRQLNGCAAEWDAPLGDNDTVSLFPLVGGG
jgi:molybdopterin converting factor small subunit